MNILIIGSGGRESAFAWKFSQSKYCTKLFVNQANAGILAHDLGIEATNFEGIKQAVLAHQIELVIVGPEEPLVKGIVDFFQNDKDLKKIKIVGPTAQGAMLEGSKDFSKAFMVKYGVPTASSRTFTKQNLEEGIAYLATQKPPFVLKADGLAGGKGVIISENLQEAQAELRAMLADAKFGEASNKVVIEQFLKGIEASIFVLSDGKSYKILPEAKDYKRIGVGDTGLNTGGMGAVSPVPFVDAIFMQKVEERIIKPTILGLQKEKIEYKGFIFIGLMNMEGEPYVIEYNARMGDPETEAVLPRIKTDMVQLMKAAATGKLDKIKLKISPKIAVTTVLVAKGYPETYRKGDVIEIPESPHDVMVFHAGTKRGKNNEILSNGGRVIAVTALAKTIEAARRKSQKMAKMISYKGKYFRKDIAKDLM